MSLMELRGPSFFGTFVLVLFLCSSNKCALQRIYLQFSSFSFLPRNQNKREGARERERERERERACARVSCGLVEPKPVKGKGC